MSKSYEQLKNPREFKVGKHRFFVSTIPAFYAQRILLKAGESMANLDLSKLPEDTVLEILSYTACENENGVKVVLDDIDIINQLVSDPKSLIALEIEEVKENFGFFFDGSLREVFQPLVELITQRGSETSMP
jgi:hypothetical protein